MEFLKRYHEIIDSSIKKYLFKSKPTELYEPMNYIVSNRGKRIRPIMVLMGCELFDGEVNKAIKPSLAIEYFHNFTLIHDDIMDEAPLRRGVETIHTKYGLNAGILSGDGLLLKSYKFFEDLEPKLFKACVRIFTHTGLLLCEGQQYDINFETQKEVTFNDYIRMITYKTGVLSASALEIGAIIAYADNEDARALFNFGKHVGIAFQIMDDYLDVFGNQERFGKKHAGDIYENKKTILYLLAKEHGTPKEVEELEYWYSKKTDNVDKVYSVEKIFKSNRVDEKTLQLVKDHNEIAQNYLAKIKVDDEKKKPFIELANYLLRRDS